MKEIPQVFLDIERRLTGKEIAAKDSYDLGFITAGEYQEVVALREAATAVVEAYRQAWLQDMSWKARAMARGDPVAKLKAFRERLEEDGSLEQAGFILLEACIAMGFNQGECREVLGETFWQIVETAASPLEEPAAVS